ncbi:MAG: fibronectin type III domain-containing protein, partial [Pyrinomonadaceae bacterium]
ADYGLTEALVDQIITANITFCADINVQALKKAEAKAATTKLAGTRKTLNDLFAKAKREAKDSGTSADKLAEISIDADEGGKSAIAPQAPVDLLVEGFSSGKNSLKWNRNGNKSGTIFIIEAKTGDETKYAIVGTTTKSAFDHKDQKPGMKQVYRVRAQRGDDFSDYSNEAVVYGQ